MDLQIRLSDLYITEEANAEKGINHANIALILAQNYRDEERQFLAIDKLIKSYFDIKKDVKTATDFLNTMKSIDTSAISIQNQALIFGHEGKIFAALNDFDKAEKAYSTQLKIYNKLGYEEGKAEANFNIGELFYHQNNFEQALDY